MRIHSINKTEKEEPLVWKMVRKLKIIPRTLIILGIQIGKKKRNCEKTQHDKQKCSLHNMLILKYLVSIIKVLY